MNNWILPAETLVEIAIWMEEPGYFLGCCYGMLRQIDRFNRHPYRWIAAVQDAIEFDEPERLEWHADFVRANVDAAKIVISNCLLSKGENIIWKAWNLYGGKLWMHAATTVGGDWIWHDYSCKIIDIEDRWLGRLILPTILRGDNINTDKRPVVYQQFVHCIRTMKLTMVEGPDGWEFVG